MASLPSDVLEQQLLSLGKSELELEMYIRELPAQIRTAAIQGKDSTANELTALYEEARHNLAAIQKEIAGVETRLYRLRRKRS